MKNYLILFWLVVAFGCGDNPPDDAPLDLAIDLDLPLPQQRGILPKAETQSEQRRTKSDAFDVRGNYSEIYGISQPFSTEVRALAEFETTEAVLIAWEPELASFLLELIESVSIASPVWVVTWDLETSNLLKARLTQRRVDVSQIRFFEFPHESFWTRDYGPISVVDERGTTSFVDPRYYPQRRRDDAIPTLMSRYFGVDVVRPPLATEGGNFMTNGQGICVVTDWLIQENPTLTSGELQRIQQQYFGCKQTLVLERLLREGTGHVDMFAKFLSPNTILVGEYDALDPQNAALLDRNVLRLENFANDNNWPLTIVRIPMPSGANGVYRSYTNSLIVNDLVIVPTYRADRRYEAEALDIYRNAMAAGYTVMGIDSEDAIQLGGAVHCTTMGFVTAQLDPEMPSLLGNDTLIDPRRGEPETTESQREPNALIPDEGSLSDTITIAESGLAFVVELGLEIEHSYLGDLIVTLTRGNFEATVLRNAGSGATDLQRNFRIDIPRGIERSGDWQLRVEDTAPQDVGRLLRWSLRFDDAI